jgi:hypothetical protein
MKRAIQLAVACLAVLVATAGDVNAGVIISPNQILSAPTATYGTNANNIINQNTLSIPFVSGVTDFDSYIASNPTDKYSTTSTFQFANTPPTQTIDMSLGGLFTIESLAFWNLGGGFLNNVASFNLLAANNPGFVGATTLLSNQAANFNMGPFYAVLPEVFAFAPTSATNVRFEILSAGGVVSSTAFNEVAFEAQAAAVPEPSSLAIFGIGAGVMGLVTIRRRRREKKQEATA